MIRRKWILIFPLFVGVLQQAHTACVCNEKGEDACASCSETIRPKPIHHKRPELEIPAIGDNCWCSKTMIEPASLPKSSPMSKPPPQTCVCPEQTVSSFLDPQVNYVQAQVKDDSPPADPISIGLAVQAGKAIQVPEAKLSYGFVKKPINSLPKVFISSIKEENLYALANEIITLKKPLTPTVSKIEDDYRQPEEEDEEETAPEDYDPPSLTYKQLGYEAEQYQNPEFVPMSPALTDAAVLIEHDVDLGCGFKPGRVATASHIRKGSFRKQ